MRAYGPATAGLFTSDNNRKYEEYLKNHFWNGLLGYLTLGDNVGTTTPADSGPGAHAAVGSTGTTFGGAGISNTALTACTFTGSTGASYIQLEANPGSTYRTSLFTLAVWFKRAGAGSIPTAGTGTGGISAEPLITKGMAENESLGLNCNFFMGLEAMGSNFYVSADFEKDGTGNATNFPVGRNGRMLDCSSSSTTLSVLSHAGAGSPTLTPHTYDNGDRIRFGGTTLGANITAGTWYFVVSTNKAAGTFQVSATSGGAAISGLSVVASGGGAWFNHAKAAVGLLNGSDFSAWHFAVVTWDGTNLISYLDGVLSENEVPTMTPPENVSTQIAAISAGITSATASNTKSGGFNGKLQHAAIWSIVLSQSEIINLWNKGNETPIAVAIPPQAILLTASSIYSGSASTIVIQLTDSSGGIDDTTVLGATVVLKKDGSTLVQATDYSFAYSNSLDQITLTATGIGATFPAGVYQVVLN